MTHQKFSKSVLLPRESLDNLKNILRECSTPERKRQCLRDRLKKNGWVGDDNELRDTFKTYGCAL